MYDEKNISLKLKELLSYGYENEVIEFKEAKNQFDFNKLGRYFSALSNEANLKRKRAAWLVFGIRDRDKEFVNTKFRTNTRNLQSLKVEKDYEHFTCPLILSTQQVFNKIRILKYRYIPDGTLFPEEVEQYDPYIIREALNNCIAHQDYSLGGKILVVENEEGKLIFSNAGSFIPKSVEEVVISDAPEFRYRNKFLAEAMVNLNMIDTIGSGIRKMFIIQKEKFFPLPDYDISNDKVKVTFIGKVLDINYARKLATVKDLYLSDIIALDKVAKGKMLNNTEIKNLKNKGLIEGRKPNYHISASLAEATDEKGNYIKLRGIDNDYCQKIIINYLEKFGTGKRTDFEKILLEKLPDVLNIYQKKNKIKNNLQQLKNKGLIVPVGKKWKISNNDF